MNRKVRREFDQNVQNVNNFEIAYSGLELLLNQDTKDRANGLAVRYGAEALGNYLLERQLRERAELLGDGVEEIAQFDGIGTIIDDELLLTACEANPLLPQCADDFDFGDSGFGIGGISVGGNGQNSVIGPGSVAGGASDLQQLASDALGDTSKDELFGGVGSRAADGNDTLAFSPPGAARVSSSVGGGGGGGGGRAGSPAPPSPSRPASPQRGGDSGPTTSKARYGLSSSALKYRSSGGLKGRRPAAKKSKGNPFKKLFGNKGRTLDFGAKGGIGSKNGDIWDRLSKRYTSVNKDNRLIVYKAKK